MRIVSSNRIKLKDWKFSSGELAKLLWIDGPIKLDDKWMLDAYFKSLKDGRILKHSLNWASLIILKIGEIYVDGKEVLKKDVIKEECSIAYNDERKMFKFNGGDFEINSKEYILEGNKLILKSFVCKKDSIEYHIPLIEVVRSILAKNKRLLYALLEFNGLDQYFSYRTSGHNLIIKPTLRYPESLIRDRKHALYISWILSNKAMKNARLNLFIHLNTLRELHFPFPIKSTFTIDTRYSEKNNIIRIEQIYNCYEFDFPYKYVEVEGVSTYKAKKKEQTKKYTYQKFKPSEINIDKEKGAKRDIDLVKISMAKTSFDDEIKVKYSNIKEINENLFVDKSTAIVEKEEDTRSVDDGLGEKNDTSLEFAENVEDIMTLHNDLYNMMMILEELKKSFSVGVTYTVNSLPENYKRKKFRYLSNGVDVRKYLFAHLMINGKNIYMLEVERENKALSTLILHSDMYYEISNISDTVNKILKKLLINSGVWKLKEINDIIISRLRHVKYSYIYDGAKKYYSRLVGRY